MRDHQLWQQPGTDARRCAKHSGRGLRPVFSVLPANAGTNGNPYAEFSDW